MSLHLKDYKNITDLFQGRVIHMYSTVNLMPGGPFVHWLRSYLLWMTGGFTPFGSILLHMMIYSFLPDVHMWYFLWWFFFDRWSILITVLFLIKSSQGPSFPPTGRGSQVAKKNLSNIVAAKIIKVQSGLLMLCAIFYVYWTIFISFCSRLLLNPPVVCLQAGIIVSYGFEIQCGRTVCFHHDKSFNTVHLKHYEHLRVYKFDCYIQRSRGR